MIGVRRQVCDTCNGTGLNKDGWYACSECHGTGRIAAPETTTQAPSLVALDAAEQALVGLLTWRTEDLRTGTATDEATLRLRDLADRLSDTINGTTKGTR